MFSRILLLALPDFADKPLDLIDDSELSSSSYASDRFLFSLYDYLIIYVPSIRDLNFFVFVSVFVFLVHVQWLLRLFTFLSLFIMFIIPVVVVEARTLALSKCIVSSIRVLACQCPCSFGSSVSFVFCSLTYLSGLVRLLIYL